MSSDGEQGNGSAEEKKNFRCCAKNIFITWSQIDDETKCSRLIIESFIRNKLKHTLEKYAIAREHHRDGGIHFHALICGFKKFDIRNARYFDINGYHPNFSSVRSFKATLNYIRKEDNAAIIQGFEDEDWITLAEQGQLDRSESVFRNLHPLQYTIHLPRVRQNLLLLSSRPEEPLYSVQDFKLERHIEWNTERVLILAGISGIGKTQFALSISTNPLLVSHWDQLKQHRTGRTIIFDDCCWTQLSREQIIHLLDYEVPRGINVKHGMVVIPAFTEKIITTNYESIYDIFHYDDEAIKRRCQFELLTQSMF